VRVLGAVEGASVTVNVGGCGEGVWSGWRYIPCGKPVKDGDRCGRHTEAAKQARIRRREERARESLLKYEANQRRRVAERGMRDFWCQVAIASLLQRLDAR
jgi:hypothetical protein